MTSSAAELTLIEIGYRDALVVTNFHLSVPEDATISGVRFDVRKNADGGLAIDDTVRIVKNGMPLGGNRGRPEPWPVALATVSYGGVSDTWDAVWTAADVRATDFGIAIAPRYTGTAGNDRAHVDAVDVTVFYSVPCPRADGGS
jgi:hypothetical protein